MPKVENEKGLFPSWIILKVGKPVKCILNLKNMQYSLI